MQKNKVIDLNMCIKTKNMQQSQKLDGRYQCIVSGNRLAGFCEVLIYDRIQNNAELFQLQFSSNRMTECWCFDKEEVLLWRYHRTDTQSLIYHQALILVGDAIRQNYKYQQQEDCSQLYASLHVQRIWEKGYYDYVNYRVDWLLKLGNPEQFVTAYLKAICNKDAVLLYDMTASTKKYNISREVYAYHWNHVLEEIKMGSYTLTDSKQLTNDEEKMCYLTICGEYANGKQLLIDVCLHLVYENGSMRLQEEHILEAVFPAESEQVADKLSIDTSV